jgi:hypothetical protein
VPPRARRKKIVVTSPEQEIEVDGDRVVISDGEDDEDDSDLIADIGDADGDADDENDHPLRMRWHEVQGGGFIGVRPIAMTPELREHFGAPRDAGILVGSLEPGGPAANAGLQVGDIVTKVDGDRIASTDDLVRTVRRRKAGETIRVELLRNRSARSLTVTVSERKRRQIRRGEVGDRGPGHRWGWWTPGPGPTIAPPPDFPELEQRLDDLERKMKELEGRLPSR